MKGVNLLRDVRQERSLADEAKAIADRYAQVRALRRAVGITYVASASLHRTAA